MFRLIQFIIFGHLHKWETIDTSVLNMEHSTVRGTRYTLRCANCGKVKKVDLI